MKTLFQNTIYQNKINMSVGFLYRIYKLLQIEGLFWIAALLFLALIVNPQSDHFTFCPLENAGFKFCPGCGLGKSISYLLHGNIPDSFDSHILAIPALGIILHRVYSIVKNNSNKDQKNN